MKFQINTRTIWEVGQRTDKSGMPHQEDSLYPQSGRDNAQERLFLICDGMGGHAAGEVASATVCEAMTKSISAADAEGAFPVRTFTKALNSAFDALDLLECDEFRKPGTTLAMLKLHADGAMIAHIGDSRVLHIRPGADAASTRLLHITSDHSLVNDLVKAGELTPEEARRSSQRNIITRAMQPRLSPRPEADLYNTSDIRTGDYFYICSDGMLEEMDNDSIREIFSREGGDIDKKREILTRATERNHDNHTAILVEITDVEQGQVLSRSVTGLVTPEVERMARKAAAQSPELAEKPEVISAPGENSHKSGAASRKGGGGNIWAWVIIVAIVAAAAVYIFTIMNNRSANRSAATADSAAQHDNTEITANPSGNILPEADAQPEPPREKRQATSVKKKESSPSGSTTREPRKGKQEKAESPDETEERRVIREPSPNKNINNNKDDKSAPSNAPEGKDSKSLFI